MIVRQLALFIAATLLAQEARAPQDKATEEVRAAYSKFVDHLNAIATSVTDDAWTPEFVGRIQGIDREPASRTGLATVSIDRVDVIDVTPLSYAVLVATRTIRWPETRAAPEETAHDSVLAVLRRFSGTGWQVACQLALSPNEEIRKGSSKSEPGAADSQIALEAILQAISSGDTSAVEQSLSKRAGRSLTGEIGRFVRGRFQIERSAPWSALAPRTAVPLRDPIATAATMSPVIASTT
jgi:hypothetical protein